MTTNEIKGHTGDSFHTSSFLSQAVITFNLGQWGNRSIELYVLCHYPTNINIIYILHRHIGVSICGKIIYEPLFLLQLWLDSVITGTIAIKMVLISLRSWRNTARQHYTWPGPETGFIALPFIFLYCGQWWWEHFFCKGRRTCLSESKYSDNQHIVCKIKSFSWKNPVYSCLEEKQFFNPIICGNWRNQFCMKQLNCCDIRTFF